MKHRARHAFFYGFIFYTLGPFIKLAMRYSCARARPAQGPVLVVANHVTDLDPVLVGLSFPRHMYYVASEHVGRWGIWSRLIRFVFAPIVRVKGKTDARGGMEILRALRRGASVCLFAEGNRSFSGVTGPVFPATGKLARASGATLVTYRLEGGYFAAPRWAQKTRRGKIYGHPVNTYTPQQLQGMSPDDITAAIARDIHEDAYARQAARPLPYRGKDLAQHLETALYLCPACGQVATLRSEGGRFWCGCGLQGTYTVYGALAGENLPYNNVRDWYTWQRQALAGLVAAAGAQSPVCASDGQLLYSVSPGQGARPAGEGELALYRDKLVCAGHTFPLGAIADLAITGRMTLTFATTSGGQYEVKSPYPRSAMLYRHAFLLLRGEVPN